MRWTVEVTESFERWWDALSEDERVSIDGMIQILELRGPQLGSPYTIMRSGSAYAELQELHVPHQNGSICVLYVADDWRTTLVLLIGAVLGHQDDRCTAEHVRAADDIYARYLRQRDDRS